MNKKLLLVFLAVLGWSLVFAQNEKTVTGSVKDAAGIALPGVSVIELNTQNGVSTDADGAFKIAVGNAAVLRFTYIGFKSQEISVGEQTTFNVTLAEDAQALGEVVVTALGIKREKKSLGYAVQEVKGETLVEAREPNLANTLSGKVAGLQVVRSSNGPAGSSKIILRGNNSLSGSNQPLIVVDGVPVDNFTGATNNDYWNPSLDMGNGLADINAEDIESMSILKGPSASALYGSRAGNGVILITTKTGKIQKGLGITVSSSVGMESIFSNPDMQNDFGQGENNLFDNRSNLSWGPKTTGQSVENWNGETVPLATYGNVGNYFGKGITSNQSVTFQQQYKSTSVYTSFNRLDDKSVLPGVKLTRTNLLARAVSKFGKDDKWTADTKIQYNNSNAENRPIGGSNQSNAYSTLYMLPRSIDITDFSTPVDEFRNMVWYGGGNQVNPYWGTKYNLNQDIRDRFLMNGSLKYQFNDWLNMEVKGGSDMYTTNTEGKSYSGGPITNAYSLGKQTFSETNFSTLVTARKDNLFSKVGGAITLGGNLMSQKSTSIGGNSGELKVPDLFSLNNGVNNAGVTEFFSQRAINSLYGIAQLSWDGYLFLDATFRNDWSSTLSPANRSFFYPSISASYVFTDMIEKIDGNLPAWLTYGKLRASYASVGNDLEPYRLYNTYSINKDPNGNTTASRGNILLNPAVRSELIKSYELGTEMRFFKSRIGFDLSLYKSNATRQLIDLPMDPLSGYSAKKINAGDIENKGIEAMVDARVFNNPDSFNWNFSLNYSANKNIVKALADDVPTYPLGGFDEVQVKAVVGKKYGEIYGTQYLRVSDTSSPFYGQLLLSDAGLPKKDPTPVRLGNQQATALFGITNSFSYKGIGFSFLVDARFGGKVFSGTLADMQQNGTAFNTVINGDRANIVVDGVVLNATTKQYEQNTAEVTPQEYWVAVAGADNLGITEANLYDASNIRLRNVQLSYNVPVKFLSNTPIQSVKIGASCNNVWLIKSHMNGLDPESVFATGTNATGFENGSAPTTRSFLFNLTIGF